jgi:NADH dehydrogenase
VTLQPTTGKQISEPGPRVVIVGAGFAGLTAARRVARLPVQVTVVDRKNHHTFQPLLYQVATAGLSPGEIAAPIRWILRTRSNVEVLLEEVVDFKLDRKKVILKEQVLDYDFLIIASGATHAYFGHEEWEPLAPGLKTIEDALEIRRRVLLAFELAERQAANNDGQGESRCSLWSSEAAPPASNSPEPWLKSRATP